MKQIFIIFLSIFIIIEISFAEVYKWVDEKGDIHFTDDITQIPEKYRSKSEKIGLPEGKIEAKPEEEVKTPKKKEDTYKDQLGQGEDYWRSRIEEWKKKLKTSQERVDSLRIKYNELTEKINDSKSSVERASLRKERDQIKEEMEQHKIKIEEAKIMLEKKITEEAQLYKAKPEWIK